MPEKKKDTAASGAALAGAGTVTAGAGALGGGIPGLRSNADKLASWKESGSASGGKVRRAASNARAKAPAVKAAPGGVFGYRTSAHQKFAERAKADDAAHAGTTTSRVNMFHRGKHAGKIPPEAHIIRHMRAGRAGASVALVGGTGAAVVGGRRAQGKDWKGNVKKSQRDSDKLHGALLGGGAATAAGSVGGARILESQGRKWSKRSAHSLGEAGKIIPNMAGHTSAPHPKGNPRVPDTAPRVGDTKIVNDKKILAGKSKKQTEAAGKSARCRHPAALLRRGVRQNRDAGPQAPEPGAGGGRRRCHRDGAVPEEGREEEPADECLWSGALMARNMSDAEIRRRKKVQGNITRTTSTLGLAGVGVGTAAALASKKPGALKAVRKVPGLKNATAPGLKDAGLYTSLGSGGIGGVGGYNFAAYTGAESRKRKQAVTKSMGVEMGYFGEEGHPIKLPEIKVPIEKAWSPTASNYDSEGSRQKRAKKYESGALVTAGGAGAYSASEGRKAVRAGKNAKPLDMAHGEVKSANKAGDQRFHPKFTSPGNIAHEKAVPVSAARAGLRHAGKSAAGAAVVAGAVGAHGALKRKRKGSWQPYAKRDATSAFGIDHTEWTAP